MKSGKADHEQLLEELETLRRRVSQLEEMEKSYKRMEKELKDSEERFKTYFEYAPDAYFFNDLKGIFVDANKTVEKVSGYKKEELIGTNILKDGIIDPKQAIKATKLLAEIALTRTTGPHEFIFNHKNGEKGVVEINAHLVTLHGKKLVLAIARDIQWRKKMEEDLKKAHDSLEKQVEKRTAELKEVNEKLYAEIDQRKKAYHTLETSLREKEALLKEIHHRVGNNMQTIIGLLELQSAHLDDESTMHLFHETQNRVRAMGKVHEKLIQSPDLSKINFRDYIESMVFSISRSYRLKPNQIQINLDVDDVLLNIDTAIPCGLILNELLTNAFQHAFPKGKNGTLIVSLHEDNGMIELIVEDDGIGLPENFDYKKSGKLGFQLVDMLTNQINGKIEVISKKGTKIGIRFCELEYQQRI